MRTFKIYIDGSHLDKQNNGRLGVGGVIIDPLGKNQGNLISEFSEELTPNYMKFNFGADKPSNPSAELVALLIALRQFKGSFSSSDYIEIYADYIGVREWMTNKWKVKESYIAEIKDQILKEIKLQKLENRIKFNWIKAHRVNNGDPDIYWNNYVDLLAKGKK